MRLLRFTSVLVVVERPDPPSPFKKGELEFSSWFSLGALRVC